MADVQRTRAALLALMADNVTGNCSLQDLRDFMVTVMNAEFAYEGDFWAQPAAAAHTGANTVRGWVQYSQLIGASAISFGRVMALRETGWVPANVSDPALGRMVLGVAANSYAAAESQAQILRRGLVFDTTSTFSVGAYLYLQSLSTGKVSVTIGTSVHVVGVVELSAWADATSSHWRFEPTWGVVA